MDELIERLGFWIDRSGATAVLREVGGGCHPATRSELALWDALEAARVEAGRMKRDIAELYEAMPMLPITAETMDAATDWLTRYCIDFYREINVAIDQALGKGGKEDGND